MAGTLIKLAFLTLRFFGLRSVTCESSGCFKFKQRVVYVIFLIPLVLEATGRRCFYCLPWLWFALVLSQLARQCDCVQVPPYDVSLSRWQSPCYPARVAGAAFVGLFGLHPT